MLYPIAFQGKSIWVLHRTWYNNSKVMPKKVTKHDRAWNGRLQQLLEFKESHGHCLVPLRYKKIPALGRWVNRQREKRNKDTLSDERIMILDDIGFCWNQNSSPPSVAWEARLQQLSDFQKEHGHCNVPQNYSRVSGLGGWVNRQRTARARDALADDRIEKLEKLGFCWNMKNDAWEIRFHQLLQYKMEHGNADVPHSFVNPELSKWVQKQRYLYTLKNRGIKTNLTDERENKLNAILFHWNPSESSWNNQYQRLCEFAKKHGHCDVPRPYPDDVKLSNWVFNQRSEYSRKQRGLKNTMAAEREAKLNRIQFTWAITEKKCATSPDRSNTIQTKTNWSEFSPTSIMHTGIHDRFLVTELLRLKG